MPKSVQLVQTSKKQNEIVAYDQDKNQVTLQLKDRRKVDLSLQGVTASKGQTTQPLYAKTTRSDGINYLSKEVNVIVSEKNTPPVQAKQQVRASKYSAKITSPSEVTVGSDITYEITINSDAVTMDPLKGVELTVEIPEGFDFSTLADNPYVDSYTYDAATHKVVFKLKDITDGVISFTFNAKTVNDNDKYNGMPANAMLNGNDVGNGAPDESTTETTIVGDVDYKPSKNFTTIPGSGKRAVTYSFNIVSSSDKGQFSTWKQVITDNIPAGAQIISNEGKIGKWEITGNEASGWQAVWTSNKLHKPGEDLGNEKDFPTLTVYYPEDQFPNGTRPPVNTAGLKVYDKNNQEYDGGQSDTQGPEMSTGTEEGVDADKRSGTNQGGGTWYDGMYNRHFQVDGSFISTSGKTARELTVEDERDKYANKDFWDRVNVYQVDVIFNAKMTSAAADYRLEYKSNKHLWEEAFSGNTAKSSSAVTFQPADSVGYGTGDKRVTLAKGERVTGIRVIIGNQYDDSVKISSTSVATLDFYLYPSYNSRETNTGGDDNKLWDNHASVQGYYGVDAPTNNTVVGYDVHIKRNVSLGTAIKAPATMNVGQDNQYTAYINNQSASFDYKNAIMKVVLPAGIYYDKAKGVSPVAQNSDAPYNLPIPKPGSGVTISTQMIAPTANDPLGHQVVVFKFNEVIPAMRLAGNGTDRHIEDKGFGYNIPVQVTNDAYVNNRNGADATSWATTEDPNFNGVAFNNYANLLHQDDYNFDATRDKIAWAVGESQILTKGGLLLTKLVSNERAPSFTTDQLAFAKDKMHWQLKLQNVLPEDVSNAQVFDRLPQKDDDNGFSTELSGPVTGIPSGATVEYSKDATSATNGSWSSDWQGAKAFRVTIPKVTANQTITMDVPFVIPNDAKAQDQIKNTATGTGVYDGDNVSYNSNEATVLITNGSVELIKTDSKTNAALQGAVFELQDDTGKTLQQGLTTDENGKITVDGLAPGNYQFIETQAPTGYELDQTPVKFIIKEDQTTAVQVSMKNKLISGGVVLTKTDSQTGAVLQGAVFDLQDSTGKTLQRDLTTDQSGKISVDDLAPGDYQFVETQAPTGYELDQTPVKFTIQEGQTSAVQVSKENKLIPGSVVLTKTDSQTGATLQGAVFDLQDEAGKTLQSGLTTGQSGKLSVENLSPGNYQFVETKAPTGYELDQTPVKFTIQKGQTSVVQVSKENKLIPGSVLLTKIDSQTGAVLQGAVFELQDGTGKTLQRDLTTDQSGKISVKDLAPGDYQFVETKAPTGYKLDQTPVKFIIEKGQPDAVKVIATNQRLGKDKDHSKPNQPPTQGNDPSNSSYQGTLPKTGDGGFDLLISLLGALILVTLGFGIYRNRKVN
ncbi:SpaA isopeptide-forming pilin-related protein [Listeria sp. PSOL-1]|uniref:SpaA isopeptide-forming pilin-related protein n=1 Tax=Listeria sp. PSOL-1 TaxID=1844999 RepID=UPI0018D6E74E|nr:SpaA isopeptide-forming pilin-related protein [Listeria sp. PSOL-1]